MKNKRKKKRRGKKKLRRSKGLRPKCSFCNKAQHSRGNSLKKNLGRNSKDKEVLVTSIIEREIDGEAGVGLLDMLGGGE